MDENVAISRARKLLKDAGVTTAPVDVEALALSLGFHISRQELADGEAGNTFNRRGKKHICVNQKDSPLRQRFTILHEIAHDVLQLPSKHGEKVPSDELECFTGRPPEEVLCDVFAAECLVPWQLIQPLAVEREFTLDHLAELAIEFQASRSCIASRFAQASKDHLAFVIAEDGVVQYSIVSKALRESRIWITKEIQLPRNSAAAKALKSGLGGLFTAELEGLDWSSSDDARRFACYEEATYYAPAKQTQSILIFEELDPRQASSGYRTSRDDDDGLLDELDGYPGWSKPR
ncbi:ImmA/IrrE family metallo-endopeptidase [Pseudomonas fluorescens]|uniref:ImmA/IrrE family metallo-endopeptidase n=1 Tax=Pseudomonas fluorescens TaxID=294 RepID=UPI001BE9BB92|nr:ImmA/IrrE family metallo-endopeptidase [Pseudomonas fluorescens]MBT2374398.1 ImmA/IrrE family metallo-endopeptidase [Pseudomonas fluorescens]